MTLERAPNDDVLRHNRKSVTARAYVVRAYVFMARNVVLPHSEAPPNLKVRVNCAGVSKATDTIRGDLRPAWMQCIEMACTLMSDHPKEPPTMEPITVTLVSDEGVFSKVDLGQTVCKYTYMRCKNV